LGRVYTRRDEGFVADFITLCAIVIVAASPLLRRLYMERFWQRGRGTVIRLEGGISTNPGPGGGTWVWTPVIEYYAAGQRFSSRFSYWQSFNAKSKYAVGDQIDILYNPRDPARSILHSWDSWISYIIISILIGSAIFSAVVRRSPNP
jgi:hypothetical protein